MRELGGERGEPSVWELRPPGKPGGAPRSRVGSDLPGPRLQSAGLAWERLISSPRCAPVLSGLEPSPTEKAEPKGPEPPGTAPRAGTDSRLRPSSGSLGAGVVWGPGCTVLAESSGPGRGSPVTWCAAALPTPWHPHSPPAPPLRVPQRAPGPGLGAVPSASWNPALTSLQGVTWDPVSPSGVSTSLAFGGPV